MKKILLFFCMLFWIPAIAQQGDELLVYAVKGNVSSIFQDKETPVRVGKVLQPGAIIKTEKGASVTMICSKGKPFTLNREGSFPVKTWKDSCRGNANTVSGNFFRYIWGQMYVYSPEHKEEMQKKTDLAVVRGDEGTMGKEKKRSPQIEFSKGMDTVYYDGVDIPLSWNGINYNKEYGFSLYDAAGKPIYKKTDRYNYIPVDSIKHLLAEGKNYKWSVSAKGVPTSKKRVLTYISREKADAYMEKILRHLDIEEDSAMMHFRIAYLLEKGHYLAKAFDYYEKAYNAAPEMELFRDQFIRFRNEFWIR